MLDNAARPISPVLLFRAVSADRECANSARTTRLRTAVPARTQRAFMRERGDGILMPLYTRHFGLALDFVWTYCALVTDAEMVPLAFVLSTNEEENAFRGRLVRLLRRGPLNGVRCRLRWQTVSLEKARKDRDGSGCARRMTRGRSCRLESVCAPLVGSVTPWSQRWRLIAIKKLYGMLFFGFDRVLVLDAEARVVKRMSVRWLFNTFFNAPSYWYTVKPGIQDAALASSMLPLLGLTRPPESWKQDPKAMAHATGVPPNAFFLDVQHWFFERRWLEALAERLEAQRGSVARAVCDPPSSVWEVLLAYGFLYNYSAVQQGGIPRPFFETTATLRDAQLSAYADRLLAYHPAGGIGEMLLAPLGREPGDRAHLTRLLDVVDNPRRPILVYRETNVAERPRLAGPRRIERDRPSVIRAIEMQHELVCKSRHLLLSVCQQPWRPFFCGRDARVVPEMPGIEYYNASSWS